MSPGDHDHPDSHPHGTCWAGRINDLELCWINVPRVASTSLKIVLREAGLRERNFNDVPEVITESDRCFMVVRNPLERFRSIIARIREVEQRPVPIDEILDAEPVFDAHAERQVWFLPRTPALRERVTTMPLHHVGDWLASIGLPRSLPRHNATSGAQHDSISDELDLDRLERVIEFYRADFALWLETCARLPR